MKCHYMDYNLTKTWETMEKSHGPKLSDSNWNEDGDEDYLKDINFYKSFSLSFFISNSFAL